MRDEANSSEGETQDLIGVTDDEAIQLMACALGEDTNSRIGSLPVTAEESTFGCYQILGELGCGGMGVVYRAKEKGIDREVALKVLVAGRFSSHELRQRFLLEYRTVAKLEHSSIVPIYSVGEIDGLPYMAMRLIEGYSLDVFMREVAWREYSVRDKISLFLRVAEAVNYAHQRGVIHRDVKPSNILIDQSGQPYLVDFGIAKSAHFDADLTQSGAVVGTPSYLAPEMLEEQSSGPTVLVDIYGLGAFLYEMLTSCCAITAKGMSIYRSILEQIPVKPSSLQKDIDRDIDTIVGKCLEKRPEDRYTSTQELIDDVDLWLRGLPILARKVGATERLRKYGQRKPLVAGLSALSLLLLLVASTTMVVNSMRISRKNVMIQAQSVELSATHSDLIEVRRQEKQRYIEARYKEGMSTMNEGDLIRSLTHWLELLKLEKGDPEREFLHRLRIGMLLDQCPRLLSDEENKQVQKKQSRVKNGLRGELVEGVAFSWSGNENEPIEDRSGFINLPERAPENMEKLRVGRATHYVAKDRSKGYRLGWVYNSDAIYRNFLLDATRSRALVYRGDALVMLSLNGGGRVLWSKWRPATTHCASVCFSANGEHIFLGTEDGHIEVLESENGEVLKTFVWKDSPIVSLAVHESGGLFVSGNESGEVVMWGMNHLRPVGPWVQFPGKIEKLDFLKKGIVEVSGKERKQRWQFGAVPVYGFNNATSMEHDFFMLTQGENGNGVFGMKASTGKKVWVDYEANSEVKEQSLITLDWQPVRMFQMNSTVMTEAGQRVVSVEADGQTVIVKDRGGAHIARIEYLSEITFVDFLYDGQVVVTGSRKGEVRLWSASTGRVISPILKCLFPVQDIRHHADTGHMAVVTEGFLPVWKVQVETRSLNELESLIHSLKNAKEHTQKPLSDQDVRHWIRHQNACNLEFQE